MGVGGAVSIIGLGFLAWFLATRDTWESDHRSDVIRLSKDTMDLIEAKDPVNAVKKYDELIRLVGKRKLIAPDLAKAVSDARDAAEIAKREIHGGPSPCRTYDGIESQAKAFVEAGDFERGIEKYEQVAGCDQERHFRQRGIDSIGRKNFASQDPCQRETGPETAGGGSRRESGSRRKQDVSGSKRRQGESGSKRKRELPASGPT